MRPTTGRQQRDCHAVGLHGHQAPLSYPRSLFSSGGSATRNQSESHHCIVPSDHDSRSTIRLIAGQNQGQKLFTNNIFTMEGQSNQNEQQGRQSGYKMHSKPRNRSRQRGTEVLCHPHRSQISPAPTSETAVRAWSHGMTRCHHTVKQQVSSARD